MSVIRLVRMQKTTQEILYWRYSPAGWEQEHGSAIIETPVSLTVNGDEWLSFMCTPFHLEALAVGFLFNEGLIESKDEIADVRVCATGDNVDVWLHHDVEKPERWWRTSGCTGGATSVGSEPNLADTSSATPPDRVPVANSQSRVIPIDFMKLKPQQVNKLIEKILEAQDLYRLSGGVHTSALSDGERLLIVTEDIGRHNTLDKIAGRCLLENIVIHPRQRVLITTGRISSEMLQKAARLGAAVVISRTAPSHLAIEMADQAGITLVGYARRDRFNVYTQHARIDTNSEA